MSSGTDFYSFSQSELEEWVTAHGEPAFRGRQIFSWLYAKGVTDFGEMTNLSAHLREKLSAEAGIGKLEFVLEKRSVDQTIKALYQTPAGNKLETVLIPDFDENGEPGRMTVCVSSQVGCAMGCTFCATGRMGFIENLTGGMIFQQVFEMNQRALKEFGKRVTNIVFMGMGEPLQNYTQVLKSIDFLTDPKGFALSQKRITVSTVGLARRIRDLADDQTGFNLAISLHAPSQVKRSEIMPVNRHEKTDLTALREAVQYYYRSLRRGVTYEYCIFDGFNDSVEDAARLAKISGWAPSKVNLIVYNPVQGLEFRASREQQLNRFIRVLVDKNVRVTVRRSRGQDIDAACGQLATSEL